VPAWRFALASGRHATLACRSTSSLAVPPGRVGPAPGRVGGSSRAAGRAGPPVVPGRRSCRAVPARARSWQPGVRYVERIARDAHLSRGLVGMSLTGAREARAGAPFPRTSVRHIERTQRGARLPRDSADMSAGTRRGPSAPSPPPSAAQARHQARQRVTGSGPHPLARAQRPCQAASTRMRSPSLTSVCPPSSTGTDASAAAAVSSASQSLSTRAASRKSEA